VKTALDDEKVDDARFYLLSADGLDGCRERADKVRDKVAAALAKRDTRAEAARWPADDVKQPAGAERDAYYDLLVATAVGDAGGMTAAAQSYTNRYPTTIARTRSRLLAVAGPRRAARRRRGRPEEIAGDDDGPGEIATAMLETPRFRGLDVTAPSAAMRATSRVRLTAGIWGAAPRSTRAAARGARRPPVARALQRHRMSTRAPGRLAAGSRLEQRSSTRASSSWRPSLTRSKRRGARAPLGGLRARGVWLS
jgi:hypothetical protein